MTRSRSFFLGSAIALSLLTPARALFADPAHPTAAEAERAHQLFEQSKPLQDSKKYPEAEKLLLEAWSLQHSADVAANLGMCQAAMGKNRDAAEHLSFAFKNLMAGATTDQRTRVKKALDLVKKDVATVHIVVQPEGAEVLVDGSTIGKAPLDDEIFVETGDRHFSASAQGFKPHTETLTAKRGETLNVAIKLDKEGDPAPASTASSDAGSPARATTGPNNDTGTTSSGIPTKTVVMIGEGALAVVGLGVGIGFLLGKNSASSDRDSLRQQAVSQVGANGCASQPNASVCVDLQDADDRVRRDSRISTIGFVGAGVAVVGLGATWLLWPESKSETAQVGFDPFRRSVVVSGRF